MRYLALATDYDGTLAKDGRVDEPTLEALERFRDSGRRLILVTGRELDELLEVFPQVDLFERVVAENGALALSSRRPRGESCWASRSRRRWSRRSGSGASVRSRWGARSSPRPRAPSSRRARGHPRAGPGVAGHLQQGVRHGAPLGREQGDRPVRRARAS